MLTSNDLQQIGKLIDDRLDKKLDQKLAPIHQELEKHTKILNQHTKQLRSLKKDQNTMLKMLDQEQMDQRKRLNRVEDALGIHSSL